MLFIPSPAPSATVSKPLTGRYLAHNHMPPRRRALLAGDLMTGKARLVEPTIAQAAMLTRVSPRYAATGRAVVFSQPHKRSAVEFGEFSLLAADNRAPTASETLAKTWAAASPAERIEFVRLIGPDTIFNTVVEAT